MNRTVPSGQFGDTKTSQMWILLSRQDQPGSHSLISNRSMSTYRVPDIALSRDLSPSDLPPDMILSYNCCEEVP